MSKLLILQKSEKNSFVSHSFHKNKNGCIKNALLYKNQFSTEALDG